MMRRISPHKDLQKDILDPMAWINDLTRETSGGAVGPGDSVRRWGS